MSPVEIIVLLVVAAICGALGQAISGYSVGGLLISIVVGFVGALIGVWIARTAKLPEPLLLQIGTDPVISFPVLWSIIGATLFVLVVGLLRRRRPAY